MIICTEHGSGSELAHTGCFLVAQAQVLGSRSTVRDVHCQSCPDARTFRDKV